MLRNVYETPEQRHRPFILPPLFIFREWHSTWFPSVYWLVYTLNTIPKRICVSRYSHFLNCTKHHQNHNILKHNLTSMLRNVYETPEQRHRPFILSPLFIFGEWHSTWFPSVYWLVYTLNTILKRIFSFFKLYQTLPKPYFKIQFNIYS